MNKALEMAGNMFHYENPRCAHRGEGCREGG